MPAIAASLASFFGERPLEVRLFDGDEERLDLFDRFCRLLFTFNRAGHSLVATCDPNEALEGTDRVIFCIGQNCAAKYYRAARKGGVATGVELGLVDQLVELLAASIPDRVEALSLLGPSVPIPLPHYRSLQWPPEPSPERRATVPHQILRFLNGEDYPHALLSDSVQSPLKAWLEDADSVPAILGRRDA